MNNKPIIIDGVDVAGCPAFNRETWHCKTAYRPEHEPYCQDFDCYYKQLQRKTQECEKLKEDLTALQQTYEACEKEYKNLSEKYFKVLELSKKGIDSYEYCIRELENENEKLKTTLNEGTKKPS